MNEDKSVIPSCLKDTFHSVPHRTGHEWHFRKTYDMADVNGSEHSRSLFSSTSLTVAMWSTVPAERIVAFLFVSLHSSYFFHSHTVFKIITSFIFCRNTLLRCIHPREGEIFQCIFFWQCSFSYPFPFAVTGRHPLIHSEIKNKRYHITVTGIFHYYW